MKIAVINTAPLPIPPVKGGAVENLVWLWIKEQKHHEFLKFTIFSAYDKKAIDESEKYSYVNCVFTKFKKDSILERVICYLFSYFGFYSYCNARGYLKKITEKLKEFDFVIFENCPNYFFWMPDIIKRKGIIHFHNESYLNLSKNVKKELLKSRAVITVSDYIKNGFMNSLKEYNKQNIYTLYNCIDIEQFTEGITPNFRENFRKQHLINENEVLVIYVGRIVEDKGVDKLIDAMEKLPDKIKLLVVGSSWFSQEKDDKFNILLKKKSNRFKKRIIFTGYISYSEIQNYYACADIACLPSIWKEPFLLSKIEAMACGLPIITTNSGGIPELADENGCIFCEPDENLVNQLISSIAALYKDNARRKSMGEYNRKKIRCYDKKYYYEGLEAILKNIETS